MTTPWTLPTIFSQYAESGAEQAHILWNDTNNFEELLNTDGRSLQSTGFLEHIARSPKHDLKNKTYYLKVTGFNFQNLPNIVSGIEVRLTARRYGRATDDTISLCFDDQDIGKNHATLDINPEKIYGGSTDLWDIEDIDLAQIQDPSFGVIVRFQAHPHWPHRDAVLIDSVEVRIH